MADSVGPFGSASWSQTEWHNAAPTWAPSGIIGTPAASVSTGDFSVSSSGLNVTVACNGDRAWLDGSGYKPDSDKTVTVTANGNVSLSRRDRLVIRRDLAAGTITVARKEGTPAATPAAPGLTQVTGGVFEAPICSFLVPPNNGTALSGFVDERVWVDPGGGGYLGGLTAYRSGSTVQPIAAGTGTVTAVLDAADAGSSGLSLDTATGEVTVITPGTYQASAVVPVREPSAGDSRLFASIYVNGTEKVRGGDSHRRDGKVQDQTSSVIPARRITVAAGDVVTLRVFHDGAAAAELLPGGTAGSAVTYMELRRVA